MVRETQFVFTIWAIGGITLGFAFYKFLPKIPLVKDNYYVRKYKGMSFMVPFLTLTYHGYKLSQFQKRKGVREIAKDPNNIISEQK